MESNDKFFELLKQRQIGERIRILFDMLMELINAQPDIPRTEFWLKLKEGFEMEQKAYDEMTKLGKASSKKPRKRRNPKDLRETDNDVSVSN